MSCKKHIDPCVRRVPVFEGLTDHEVISVQDVITSRSFQKGEYIFQEGEPSRTLYVVHEGLIKIFKLSDEGKEQIIRILFPGDFFGQYALLENRNHYAHAEVLEKATVCEIRREDFSKILERNPDMALRFMMALSERLQLADEWMGTISLMEVERRLAKALLMFYEKTMEGDLIHLPVSKKDFASLIGTTPETLSRKLFHFQSLQVIELEGRKSIRILKYEELKALAG